MFEPLPIAHVARPVRSSLAAMTARFLFLVLIVSAGGCVGNRVFVSDNSPPEKDCLSCRCAGKLHTVFLVSSQGSQPGPGGSQFSDYALSHYKGQADFVYEPMLSSWFSPPTDQRLEAIADDIVAAVGNNQHHVDVWAFSMGANSMGAIAEKVKKKNVSDHYMHVILIDPMILTDPFGHVFVSFNCALGLPIAKHIRGGEEYIQHSQHYLNLSGGTIINIDFYLNPVRMITHGFNADRHYCWEGKNEMQRKVREHIDMRLAAALRECYVCPIQCSQDPVASNSR